MNFIELTKVEVNILLLFIVLLILIMSLVLAYIKYLQPRIKTVIDGEKVK